MKYILIIRYLIALTRIPFGPNSSAKHFVNISKALLDIQYKGDIEDCFSDTTINYLFEVFEKN
jgi:hypothetical protein